MSTVFTMDADWLEYHPAPSKPVYVPPAGAVDAHCHVFGPGHEFPFAEERKYTPCDASKHDLWELRKHLGFSRSVIVQATCHGADNQAMTDALLNSDNTARGVATVRSDITDEQLQALHVAGVRGIRFNFLKRLVDTLPHATLESLAERIAPLGWHIVIYFEAQDLEEHRMFFANLPGTVVFDHMGRPDLSKPADGPEFDAFIQLMADHEHLWCKVTCPDRLSIEGPPRYADFIPFARRVVEQFSDRVLWGTDWPHPNMKSHMADDGHLVDMIPQIAVSDEHQQKLLVDNPLKLYWAEDVTT